MNSNRQLRGRSDSRGTPNRVRPSLHCVLNSALFLIALGPLHAFAQHSVSSEQKIKVAYLYNFLRYVRWPESAFTDDTSPIVIGILRGDPHDRLLDQVAVSKTVRGRSIVVRRLNSVNDAQHCHLVFLHAGTTPAWTADAIRMTDQQSVLLILDSGTGSLPGVPIRFFADHDGTIGLQINVDAMGRRGLQPDAKLLNIASVVRD